jgi:putative membrane protein
MKYLILLPGVIHIYIFILESFLWDRPRTMAAFRTTPATVTVTKSLAFNQGFYNLFLAAAVIGGFSLWMGFPAFESGTVAGLAVMVFGLGSITAAGLVLLISAPALWRSALIQIVPAGLGLTLAFIPI